MMDFTSSSHPTRFISMAASSLDITLQSNPHSKTMRNNNFQHEQIRHEKQYIDPNSMINFEKNMQSLGNDFEKARRKLEFSTNSLQSQLTNINNNNNNIDSALFPHNATSRSLSPIRPNKKQKNTSLQISCIGSVIDGRLQNLRAKLHKLEQEDEIKSNSNTAISLPLPPKPKETANPLNTSFTNKYRQYMLKYHGQRKSKKQSEYKHHYDYNTNATSHSFPEYDHNVNINAHNLVSRIQQKSKALFETDIYYKSNKIRPYIMDDKPPKVYEKRISNFDDELNKTWRNTQLQLKKLQRMNQEFNRKSNKISVSESIASSHWALDSQTSDSLQLRNMNNISTVHTLNVVNEEAEFANANSVETHSFYQESTNGEHGNVVNVDEKVLNQIPTVCSHCNQIMDQKSSYFAENNLNQEEKVESIDFDNNKSEINTTMSERDRKQFILDLKSMDGDNYCYGNDNNFSDCKSDGILFEDKYKNKTSLRAKVNDLKMNMNGKSKRDNNRSMTIKNEEYLYLKQKLKIYENKLRNIDPSLLE